MSVDVDDHLLLDEAELHLSLDSLPPDLLANCLQHLCSADIHSLQQCSTSCRAAVADERVWFALCSKWSPYTNIRLWLPDPTASPPDIHYPIPPPSNYGQLYQLLKIVAPLALPTTTATTSLKSTHQNNSHSSRSSCGIWRIVGEDDSRENNIIVCHWTDTGIQPYRLMYTSLDHPPEKKRYISEISPRRGLTCKVEWGNIDLDDTNNVTLVDISPGLRRTPSASCETTEAAASTALPFSPSTSRGGGGGRNKTSYSSGAGSTPLGSSPPGSFEAEWLMFMASNVAVGRSKLKKRSSRLGAQSTQPILHHLRRVVVPIPTARHPLSGLWVAAYPSSVSGANTVYAMHVLKIYYDFSGPKARIIAEKLTSGGGWPAGSITFTATAAPLPLPWSDTDSGLVDSWRHDHWEQHLAAGLDGGLEGLLLEDEHNDNDLTLQAGSNSTGNGTTSGTVDSTSSSTNSTSISHNQVVSVHMGVGTTSGDEECEGRLWVHGNGWLSFHWFVDGEILHGIHNDNDVGHACVRMRPLRATEL